MHPSDGQSRLLRSEIGRGQQHSPKVPSDVQSTSGIRAQRREKAEHYVPERDGIITEQDPDPVLMSCLVWFYMRVRVVYGYLCTRPSFSVIDDIIVG